MSASPLDLGDAAVDEMRALRIRLETDPMTLEEFQVIGRGMIMAARLRFRDEAFGLCRTDEERAKALELEPAIGEVSPEEAVLAFKLWLAEQAHR